MLRDILKSHLDPALYEVLASVTKFLRTRFCVHSLVNVLIAEWHAIPNTPSIHVLQHIQDTGVSEESLDDDLKERIQGATELEMHDEGVASVLLASLQGEFAELENGLRHRETELAQLRNRYKTLLQRSIQIELLLSAIYTHEWETCNGLHRNAGVQVLHDSVNCPRITDERWRVVQIPGLC